MIRVAFLILFLLLSWMAPAQQTLDARERLLAAAGLLEAAESAGDRVAALTDAIRAYEAGLAAMRGELRALTLQERTVAVRLSGEDADLSTLLAMMQNATQQTETQSLLHPGSAVDTIRAGTLASVLVPALYARAADLEDALRELEDLRAIIETAETGLAEGRAGVQKARVALAEALAARTGLPPRLATNEAAMEALVNSADTLSGLADSLLSARDGGSDFSQSRWEMPVAGQILAPFGTSGERPGWVVATEPEALVVSPTAVTVRFSGEIPEYGTVTILEADAGRLMVFAGLSNSFVTLGQVLDAGEPVGFAGKGQLAAQDKLNASGGESSLISDKTLYIEFRQGGAPVDPATVLKLEQEQG